MLRRTIATGAIAAAVTIAAIAPARADAPKLKSYDAASSASALEISLAGQTLGISQTQAAVNSKPEAAADGAALLIAGTPVPGAAPSAAPAGPATNSACPLAEDLAQASQGNLSGLRLEVACLNTSAAITDGAPTAQSGAGEVRIQVLGPGGALLDQILKPVFAAAPQVGDLTAPLLEALAPILGPVKDTTQIDVPKVLDDILTAVGDTEFVLAEIVVAPSQSKARASSQEGVVAEAGSNGVTINILPGIAATLDGLTGLGDITSPSSAPLLQVKLGTANARVVRDAVTGVAAPDASAAQLLGITASDSLGILQGILGQAADAINGLAVDQLGCNASNPLAPILCIEVGAVNELDAAELDARKMNFGAGTVGREASAAHVEILGAASDALGAPVLGLSFSRATAAANAVVADVPGTPESPAQPSLPRTGGDSTLPMTLALLAVGAAGMLVLRRTRSA